MTRAEYEVKRQNLINEAESFINEGKIEDANKAMDDVKKLEADIKSVL